MGEGRSSDRKLSRGDSFKPRKKKCISKLAQTGRNPAVSVLCFALGEREIVVAYDKGAFRAHDFCMNCNSDVVFH